MDNVYRPYLTAALVEILANASGLGSMAFVRCLPNEGIAALLRPDPIPIPGWQVFAVVNASQKDTYCITADQAVDLREEKKGKILLLVNQREVGVGMDGIYSAVREISESELFDKAVFLARKKMAPRVRDFTEAALRQAKTVGKINSIAPWREFEFMASCAFRPDDIGKHVALIGLWPIATTLPLRIEDCEVAARVVDRLLRPVSPSTPIHTRVDSLLLPDDSATLATQLSEFLSSNREKRWTEVVLSAQEKPNLWLNKLKPGFVNQDLKSLELVSWRAKKNGPPHKWSGLTLDEGNLIFVIDEANRTKSKLEVRWKTQPPDLKIGALEYEVTIQSGDEELVRRTVSHNGKEVQKCVFADEDFDPDQDEGGKLEAGGKWDAFVCVRPIGEEKPPADSEFESLRWKETESFTLTFGTREAVTKSSTGRKVRALVEEAIKFPEDEFDEVCRLPRKDDDSRGYISCDQGGTKYGLVYRPPLLKLIEEQWRQSGCQIGRWVVQVRPEGTRSSDPVFIPIQGTDPKLDEITRQMGQTTLGKFKSFVATIYCRNELTTNYVNAWATGLESGPTALALAHTLEVQTLQGKTIGLIVLPSHPIRIAWHQAYDELARFARYEEKLSPNETQKTLAPLDGSYVPAFLPGVNPNSTFVFGDVLGFYTVAMLRSDDPEPQGSIALLARCLSPELVDSVPSVGITTAAAISREVGNYLKLHPNYSLLRLHALRPGDGLTVTQALGQAIQKPKNPNGDEDTGLLNVGFSLDLYPSQEALDSRVVGRYITEVAQKRRNGLALDSEEQWMLKPFDLLNVQIPRLRWAKRKAEPPKEPAHLSIAFDTFESTVEVVSAEAVATVRPLEAFGLYPSLTRRFDFTRVPTWTTTLALKLEGEKHPAGGPFTQRLNRLHAAIAHAVAVNLGGPKDTWPVFTTRLNAQQADSLRQLHELSDWVITVDRNAGIEYFDSPQEAEDIYNTYVIDCVPERQDLDCVRLVTSTSNIEEVKRLLDQTLAEMNLSCSPRNCEELLARLKAISGRLAMRLTHAGNGKSELIALAKFYEACAALSVPQTWFSLTHGFFVPIDDVRDLLLKDLPSAAPDGTMESGEQPLLRADLMYVSLGKQKTLQLSFIEIKYRRILKDALNSQLYDDISHQIERTRERWETGYFSNRLTVTQLAIRRKRCARALLFYLEKARRHALKPEIYEKLVAAIEKLFRAGTEVAAEVIDDRGYIFCPEYHDLPRLVDERATVKIFLFGPQIPVQGPPQIIPRVLAPLPQDSPSDNVLANSDLPLPPSEDSPTTEISNSTPSETTRPPENLSIHLGNRLNGEDPVNWSVSIAGNPHLMIVGLPGMGKTNCIINLSKQLVEHKVTPIVFAFHDDIELKLSQRFTSLHCVDLDNGLGFNPMQVVKSGANSWLDTVGMLRDIFWSIYPDFGDLQANIIRDAIKQSFVECGFGTVDPSDETRKLPEFARFFEILRRTPKPNVGVVSRLSELADYGFFKSAGDHTSLLDLHQPVVIRLYASQNEELQNAMASFALLNLYQNMFIRGLQPAISHVVIFDEAHRANRLKLIPTMAKECRKYGIGMVVASQEAKDFSPSLFAAIANYLILRVTEIDAKTLAKVIAPEGEAAGMTGRLKHLAKYSAVFLCEGQRPVFLNLAEG